MKSLKYNKSVPIDIREDMVNKYAQFKGVTTLSKLFS